MSEESHEHRRLDAGIKKINGGANATEGRSGPRNDLDPKRRSGGRGSGPKKPFTDNLPGIPI